MVHVQRTFTVPVEITRIAAYLRDFANAVQWDPGTMTCTQSTPDPIAVGTKWDNLSKVLGRETELTYELTQDAPDHITLTGKNKTATSIDDIRLARINDESTEVVYVSDVTFNGLAKIAGPILKFKFEKIGDEMEREMPGIITANA